MALKRLLYSSYGVKFYILGWGSSISEPLSDAPLLYYSGLKLTYGLDPAPPPQLLFISPGPW